MNPKTDLWFQSVLGTVMYPFDPERTFKEHSKRQIVELLATSLSKIPRFCGHTKFPYSVAEHCVHMAREAEKALTNNHLKWALLHELWEIVGQDLPGPVRNHPAMSFYVEAEAAWLEEGFKLFGLELTLKEQADCEKLDLRMLARERRILMPSNHDWGEADKVEPLYAELKCWGWQEAHMAYLSMASSYLLDRFSD